MAVEWQNGLDNAIATANDALSQTAGQFRNLGLQQAQGFTAEQWHAQTFNIDAYKKGLWDLAASTPGSTDLGSPDVVVRRGGEEILIAQLKYFKTPLDTAKQLWNPAYSDGTKVVPAGQLDGVIEQSAKKVVSEAVHRPHVAESARHTVDQAADRVAAGGAVSTPLSRQGSSELADDLRRGEQALAVSDALSLQEIGQRMAIGGGVAAGIGFAIGAAPHMLRAIEAWRKGQRIGDEEFERIIVDGGRSGATAAGWAGLTGAVATGLVHLASTGFLGEVIGQVGPGSIGALAVVAVHGLRNGLAMHRGEIDGRQFALRTATNAVVAASGVAGAALGQALIPVPVLGALVGSVFGSLAGRLGVAALQWTANALAPHVRAAVHRTGEVLFAWDLIAEAQVQSLEIKERFARAGAVARGAAVAEFRAFSELQLPAMDSSSVVIQGAAQESALSRLEEAWRHELDDDGG